MKIGNEDVKLYLGDSEVEKIYLGTEQVYGGEEPTPPHDYSQDYFTIESTSDDNTISFTMGTKMTTAITTAVTSVSVSTDNGSTWTQMRNIGAGASLSVTLNNGEKAIWKGEAVRYSITLGRETSFSSTGQFKVYGNIMSLISGDTFENAETLTGKCTFCALFKGCTGLTSAENLILPATTLTTNCYNTMFRGCTNLTTAPELPATTLADSCYSYMFWGCTSLTTAPELPAETLANSCYASMFNACTSLTTAPELPATTLVDFCYSTMFNGCTNLTTAPALPATTLASNCYSSMFRDCESIATAPELSAMILADKCYDSMFDGCDALITAPELPATTLTQSCYKNMFSNCTSLNYIKCLATDISATQCTTYWVSGASSTGTFVKAASMNDWPTGDNGIPNGWTVQDDAE